MDPITPVGILDRLSFVMGVHEETSIVVLDLGKCGVQCDKIKYCGQIKKYNVTTRTIFAFN